MSKLFGSCKGEKCYQNSGMLFASGYFPLEGIPSNVIPCKVLCRIYCFTAMLDMFIVLCVCFCELWINYRAISTAFSVLCRRNKALSLVQRGIQRSEDFSLSLSHPPTHTHTHTRTHARTQTHTHTRMHARTQSFSVLIFDIPVNFNCSTQYHR